MPPEPVPFPPEAVLPPVPCPPEPVLVPPLPLPPLPLPPLPLPPLPELPPEPEDDGGEVHPKRATKDAKIRAELDCLMLGASLSGGAPGNTRGGSAPERPAAGRRT